MAIDTHGHLRKTPGFGAKYTKRLLAEIRRKRGIFLVAVDGSAVVGFICAIPKPQTSADLLEYVPMRLWRITELFITRSRRGKGVGTLLMDRMEAALRGRGCTMADLRVDAFNEMAHAFYRKRGFRDLIVDMRKRLH
ncbi:MAG: Ribosomal-protein-alanine acetyltransferase [Candidatus Peregrinibacteria bacterium Gr01-1014_25]|nr:MAG: Ribosomal-protein-alanine acetyltransferase [Candidatus Peregrinibacteria bacterium Gr01-1014_25]